MLNTDMEPLELEQGTEVPRMSLSQHRACRGTL